MSYSGKFKDKDNNLHPVTSVLYGTCDTAAATAAKVVTCSDFDRLMTGVTIRVKFTYGNTAASPTVNINNTGATAVYCYGSTAPVGGTSWQAGAVVELVYDGTSFFIVGSATSGSDDIVAAEFSTATTYAAGDYCIYDGCLYKFKTSHTGAWAAADVDSITVTGELKGKQDIFERISYADWQLLSPQQQAAKPYYIYDYPSTAITAANVSYDHTQSGLSATTAQGGIDELASEKQDATDNNLTTTNKTIVGGINEIKSGLTNVGTYSNTEVAVGTYLGHVLYRREFDIPALPDSNVGYTSSNLGNVSIVDMYGIATNGIVYIPLPFIAIGSNMTTLSVNMYFNENREIVIATGSNRSGFSAKVVLYYYYNT